MCWRAVAWTASAAVEAPNPQTPDPTLDPKPHPKPHAPNPQIPVPPNRVLLGQRATRKPLTSHSLPLLSHASFFPKMIHSRATPLQLPPPESTYLRATYEPLTGHGRPRHLSTHSLSVHSARLRHRATNDIKVHHRATSNGAARMCQKTAAASSRSQVTLMLHQRMHGCTRSVSSLTNTFLQLR